MRPPDPLRRASGAFAPCVQRAADCGGRTSEPSITRRPLPQPRRVAQDGNAEVAEETAGAASSDVSASNRHNAKLAAQWAPNLQCLSRIEGLEMQLATVVGFLQASARTAQEPSSCGTAAAGSLSQPGSHLCNGVLPGSPSQSGSLPVKQSPGAPAAATERPQIPAPLVT